MVNKPIWNFIKLILSLHNQFLLNIKKKTKFIDLKEKNILNQSVREKNKILG